MAPPRKWHTAATQSRLNADLALQQAGGGPILYRKVPGQKRRYYDPKRPERPTVSEDYVVRVYKKAINPEYVSIIRQSVRTNTKSQSRVKRALAETWIVRQQYENGVIYTPNEALRQPEFLQTYQQLREAAFLARHSGGIENESRDEFFRAGGEYSELLVAMGRRTGLETFPIGESPLHVSSPGASYIDTVVQPWLRGEINLVEQQEKLDEIATVEEPTLTDEQVEVERLKQVADKERIFGQQQAANARERAELLSKSGRQQAKYAKDRGYDSVEQMLEELGEL